MLKTILSDKKTNLSLVLSLLACLLTATQTVLIIVQGVGMCFNQGCRVVDSLTTVPPVVFNFVGFLYFQAIIWGLLLGRKSQGSAFTLTRILGLAGMASEGVLIAFQYLVSEAFCSYCLVIFTFIVLLNLSFGFRQMVAGAAVFTAVLVAFASLQFKTAESMENLAIERGTYGVKLSNPSDLQLYLFFSSTCPHCEKVIETLRTKPSCNVNFQPIDSLRGFDFPDLALSPKYSPSENRDFLKMMGIEEIPVLMARDGSSIWILQGEQMIRLFLEQNCGGVEISNTDESSSSTAGETGTAEASVDGSCSIAEDCGPLSAKDQYRFSR